MELLHDVAERPESKSLSRYQVIDITARILLEKNWKTQDDEEWELSMINAIRTRLTREQDQLDYAYLSGLQTAYELYIDEVRMRLLYDPETEAEPSIPGEETWMAQAEEDLRRQYATLPQGFSSKVLKDLSYFLDRPAKRAARRRIKSKVSRPKRSK